MDFAGPFQGSMFMIIVDAHYKWLKVVLMSNTTTDMCSAICLQDTDYLNNLPLTTDHNSFHRSFKGS